MSVLDQEKVDRIKRLLKWHQRGMTISDLASEMKINRNLVAKYLDMLLISGQVEMQIVGAAKVFFLSRRVPVSALLEFSSHLVIVLDSDGRILQINEQVPLMLEKTKDSLIGKNLRDLDDPFIGALQASLNVRNPQAKGESVADIDCIIRGEQRHFRVKQVPTAFEDGSDGLTFIAEDITTRKRYEEMLRISEARYRGLVQSSGEAIIGSDPAGKIVSWNPAAERLCGYKEDEIVGTTMDALVPAECKENLSGILKQVHGGESIRRKEIKMVRKGGAVLDALITISPILGEHGAVTGASSIARDITGEKMEQYLREHEDQYRTLVEDLNVGIYRSTGDPRGRFVWGNTALLNILGYTTISDLQDIPVIDVFSDPAARLELLEELRNKQFVKNRVLHLKRHDGSPVSVSVTALAEFDEKRQLVFINGIVQDITHFTNTEAGYPEHS
ncbi:MULTISPECIES: PAS domain-containing protein [unclassified Methanoregula]|uniref:PAS domain-containing protein n=1 Tax=unclassified Methanoregula TaxID=2649730 RepID=UPI0009C70D51|nr:MULTISPECIES: PAS domain-containing protein [unclassified Methanoregula]OPX64315.1 MAG: sensory histidine kinase AtoS [Methanoregula sp. PtaB.Bin085]OPY33560.1 MAG: sensory histidine kinase AtoS [Methanoregula sp. PtaU1.Bin006]